MKHNNNTLLSCLYDDLSAQPCNLTRRDRGVFKDILLESTEYFDTNRPKFMLVLNSISLAFGFHLLDDHPLMQDITTRFKLIYQLVCFDLKVRQKKYTDEQKENYTCKIKEIEQANRALRIDRNADLIRTARKVMRFATKELDLSPTKIAEFSRHGPGAVFNRETHDDKSWFRNEYRTLNSYFPADWFHGSLCTLMDDYGFIRNNPIVCRLALVPKDWKGPRGVFISPKEAIFCQLGIDGAMKDYAMRNPFISQSYVPDSQLPSGELSLFGSASRSFSTIDLSDASDRITVKLCSLIFHRSHYLALACTRPSHIMFPDGDIKKLFMMSPMGDGKTFPCLSYICWCITVSSLLLQRGYVPANNISNDILLKVSRDVKIFGDDIICPSEYFDGVCMSLEACGLRVNRRKSFSKGPFREACGIDSFNGTIVTPLRQKVSFDESIDHNDLVGIIEFHNRIKRDSPHLVKTLGFLRSYVLQRLGSKIAFSSNYDDCAFSLYEPDANMCMSCNLRREGVSFRVSGLHYLEVSGLAVREIELSSECYCDRYRYNYSLFPSQTQEWGTYRTIRKSHSPIFDRLVRHIMFGSDRPRRTGLFLSRAWVKI